MLPLHETRCAICGTADNAETLYDSTLTEDVFRADIFSARRLPDRIHYRLVRCRSCGLIRSDPVASPEALHALYAESTLDYSGEIGDLTATYGRYLAGLSELGIPRGALLEIGCGNGFVLQAARDLGFGPVKGVEPSAQAIAVADAGIKGQIVNDVMRPGLFLDGEFQVVAMFQVFDHLSDPLEVLRECYRVLQPGGALVLYNHNVRAISARLLGERSPIIDVEHTYLYDPRTTRQLLEKAGFRVASVRPAFNTYSLQYLVRLTPFPKPMKMPLLSRLRSSRLGEVRLRVPLGNLFAVAIRP
jgi:SAM-dependent methyltransferase